MTNNDDLAYREKHSRLWERYDEAAHDNAEHMRDILESTLDALESAEQHISRQSSLLAERTADKAENASLRQRVAELEALAAEYGMKFQRAQDDLKKARILCEDATMRANRADFEGYSRAVREYGSKTVSVKLPAVLRQHETLKLGLERSDGYGMEKGSEYMRDEIIKALAAAGIKLEVGE